MTRDSQKRKPDATSNNDTTGLVRSSDAGTLVIAVMSSSLFQNNYGRDNNREVSQRTADAEALWQRREPDIGGWVQVGKGSGCSTHADSEAVADVLPLRDAAVALDATAAVLDAVLDAAGVLEDADAVGPMAKDALVARMPLMSDILMKPWCIRVCALWRVELTHRRRSLGGEKLGCMIAIRWGKTISVGSMGAWSDGAMHKNTKRTLELRRAAAQRDGRVVVLRLHIDCNPPFCDTNV
ncbi:hypothetical protein B0H10DRAFT_1959033 [Mycena sp. CBHHK59/15]|nr:hypothetical protein B0H10DRAFT_1959033 [Mycena sp. CBHHK59/15]